MWFDSYPDEKAHVSVAPLPTTGLGPAMALLSAMPERWGRVRVPVPATPVSLSAAIVEGLHSGWLLEEYGIRTD